MSRLVRATPSTVPESSRAGPKIVGMASSLVVKVTAGSDAPERCSQAFTVATTALVSGTSVSLWLTGESAWFALPGRAAEFELPHAAPLPDLLDALITAGQVTLCTQCAARRDIGAGDVIPGIRIAGAATFVEEALADDTQALVY
jgi:predicted peroxiredoxin